MTDQTGFRRTPLTKRRRMLVGAAMVFAVLVASVLLLADRSRRTEVPRLAELLSLREGMTVGEIGAGRGWLTVEVAKRAGPSGRVYSTELSAARLDDIRHAVAEGGLSNVTVLEAGERATKLPAGCCEAIFMRRVYHHLSDPSAILASIHAALTPGGRLVIIEFRRAGLVGSVTRMGIDPAELIDAVTAAGFELTTTEDWPGWDHYVAVFKKSASLGRALQRGGRRRHGSVNPSRLIGSDPAAIDANRPRPVISALRQLPKRLSPGSRHTSTITTRRSTGQVSTSAFGASSAIRRASDTPLFVTPCRGSTPTLASRRSPQPTRRSSRCYRVARLQSQDKSKTVNQHGPVVPGL